MARILGALGFQNGKNLKNLFELLRVSLPFKIQRSDVNKNCSSLVKPYKEVILLSTRRITITEPDDHTAWWYHIRGHPARKEFEIDGRSDFMMD
mmetsp:Transcript_33197/g.38432  ORF Transcript_33197/g.38432 Transcript_33197/m.38432 type:complete len:94 (+) Transcript_33197:372-653(+)